MRQFYLLKIKSNGKYYYSFTKVGFMKHSEQLNLIDIGYNECVINPVNLFLLLSML